ncbi:hypothetical protein T484DRAFT_3635131 [Baffinella frigidus]|nr:hypothetical protein T484DRAFT_3635131 [Cryptophyta sp. CCMP2293]
MPLTARRACPIQLKDMKRNHEASAEQAYAEKRFKERTEEYDESFSLLLELVHHEPTLAQAFRIIESKVLHGVLQLRVNNIPASPAFIHFATSHYVPFCRSAIRAMFTYGFVPWHFRPIRSGDQVPEVLPAGSFTWSIIKGNAANESCDYGDDASKTLLYDVSLSNTDPIYTYEKAQVQLHTRDDDIQHMFNKKATAHMPYVYTLPMDVSLEQTQQLNPCIDIPFLDSRFKNDIASLTGIPSELLANRGMANESSARTRTSTHQFHLAMDSIAQQLQLLLADVCRRAYHNQTDHRPRGQSWSTSLSSGENSQPPNTSTGKNSKPPNTSTGKNSLPRDPIVANTTDKDISQSKSQPIANNAKKKPVVQWFIAVAPPIEMDTVDDLVKLAAIEGALNPFEIRRIVQMLLYGKGTPAGSMSNLCTLPLNTKSNTTSTGGLPKEASIIPKPKEDPPKKK